MQIGIMESKDFSSKAIEELQKIGQVLCYKDKDLDDFLQSKEILFIRLKYYIDIDFLEKAKKLKYICTPTTGLNHIDLEVCKKKGIKVISLKNESSFLTTIRATPEHTFGLVLSLLRNYKTAFLNDDNQKWDRDKYKGYELYGKTVGIIGLGRVGKILANYFKAFDSEILFYDIDEMVTSSVARKKDSIEKLIDKSDIIILSASYFPQNHQFFHKDYIDLLKDKYFINTARGELVDEKYLISKIKDNYFKGIAIDVIQNETHKDNILNELLRLTFKRNLIVTPHIGGATYESMWKTEEFIVKKLINQNQLCYNNQTYGV